MWMIEWPVWETEIVRIWEISRLAKRKEYLYQNFEVHLKSIYFNDRIWLHLIILIIRTLKGCIRFLSWMFRSTMQLSILVPCSPFIVNLALNKGGQGETAWDQGCAKKVTQLSMFQTNVLYTPPLWKHHHFCPPQLSTELSHLMWRWDSEKIVPPNHKEEPPAVNTQFTSLSLLLINSLWHFFIKVLNCLVVPFL